MNTQGDVEAYSWERYIEKIIKKKKNLITALLGLVKYDRETWGELHWILKFTC